MGDDIRLTKLAKCAGCGAKVGAGTLQKLLGGLRARRDPDLLVGFDTSDDASVYRVSDRLALVNTVDFFPPVADDPYLFGQIAAANALSDIYAMGGVPKVCQNILVVPETMPPDAVREILRGGYDKVYEAGAVLSGGHSVHGPEPMYGLAVTGYVDPRRMWTNAGARTSDALVLTKPLGVGTLLTARKAELLGEESAREAFRWMTTLNRAAQEAASHFNVHACTDITGFSLMGHGVEMAQASGVSLEISPRAIPLLPEALDMARMGLLPESMYRNRSFAQAQVELGELPTELADLLFDPQTSGGLLLALPPEEADALIKTLPGASLIGRVTPKSEKSIYLIS